MSPWYDSYSPFFKQNSSHRIVSRFHTAFSFISCVVWNWQSFKVDYRWGKSFSREANTESRASRWWEVSSLSSKVLSLSVSFWRYFLIAALLPLVVFLALVCFIRKISKKFFFLIRNGHKSLYCFTPPPKKTFTTHAFILSHRALILTNVAWCNIFIQKFNVIVTQYFRSAHLETLHRFEKFEFFLDTRTQTQPHPHTCTYIYIYTHIYIYI